MAILLFFSSVLQAQTLTKEEYKRISRSTSDTIVTWRFIVGTNGIISSDNNESYNGWILLADKTFTPCQLQLNDSSATRFYWSIKIGSTFTVTGTFHSNELFPSINNAEITSKIVQNARSPIALETGLDDRRKAYNAFKDAKNRPVPVPKKLPTYSTYIKDRSGCWCRYECVQGHYFTFNRLTSMVIEYDENDNDVAEHPMFKEQLSRSQMNDILLHPKTNAIILQ
jgi:hypothetical protein